MWLDDDLTIRKQDLVLSQPFVNAAGMLGFTPDPHTMPFLNEMGAFITHPISRRPRVPAGNRCCLPFPGGFLLHTGLPNPGISRAVSRYRWAWANAPLPVIVHLLVETPEALVEMIHKIEGLENVLAIELGLSPECTPEALAEYMEAAIGELPAIPCLNPDQVPVLLSALKELAPTAVHLTLPRGTLPGPDGALVTGRLYGPAVFPQMLKAAQTLVDAGLQVIADGGGEAMLSVGVTAVGLAESLWEGS
jgi:dihydroorotate dehydrogenase (NAD+) catalytic subunit